MPAYEINYRYEDGSLTAKIETHCACDKEAKILAHAMRVDGTRRIEVWREEILIYARPQIHARIAPSAMELRPGL
ncbi:MAG: hypothetical protein JSR81_09355 [Proteobacteria bacterium]|nr:hypothetical protein [Pseudomonadota bacterium]